AADVGLALGARLRRGAVGEPAVRGEIVPEVLQVVPPAGALPALREGDVGPGGQEREGAELRVVRRILRGAQAQAAGGALFDELVQVLAEERVAAVAERRLAVVAGGVV